MSWKAQSSVEEISTVAPDRNTYAVKPHKPMVSPFIGLKKLLSRMEKSEEFFRFSVLICGLALITRLMVLMFFWSDWIWQYGKIHDSWNKLAINMVESGTFGFSPNEPTLWRGPIFPLVEVPLYLLFGENYVAWSVTLLLFDVCTCLLIMTLGRNLWGNRPALLAGLFHAIHLPVI